ncbi:MAG: hypothetical protein WAK91_18110, partial [Candidatus Acidiferrales bacterium]
LTGIVVLWRRKSVYAFPVSVFPIVYPFAEYLAQALLRYRHPIDPVVMLLTAIAIAELWRMVAPERGRSAMTQ